ncbi:MAG: hydratase [Burkholderiales bacterium]|nr:hydratase [Burkholderiales bacterium]
MDAVAIERAARCLLDARDRRVRIAALPESIRPVTRADGYRVQAEFARLAGQATRGWKIAATSAAGQAHIGVDGPLAGRLLADRVLPDGGHVPFAGNGMRVAEAEFAFVMGAALPARTRAYEIGEVVGAAERVHPAIEIPDSRYGDFVTAGAPQLIADNACACWFVLGAQVRAPWRDHDFGSHAVRGWRNGGAVAAGTGANVLGDPRIALTWLANELRAHGIGLAAGQIVTTGTCVVPFAIEAGDRIAADFGPFGRVEALIAAT